MKNYVDEWKKYLAEQTQPVADDGKADLIEVITNHLNKMKTNQEWTAPMVAQAIYNDCAHWMNKTDVFADRPGAPMKTKAPFAPEQ